MNGDFMQQKQKISLEKHRVEELINFAKEIENLTDQTATLVSQNDSIQLRKIKNRIEHLKNNQHKILINIFESGLAQLAVDAINDASNELSDKAKEALEDAARSSLQAVSAKNTPVYLLPIKVSDNFSLNPLDSKTLIKLEMAWKLQQGLPCEQISIDSHWLTLNDAKKLNVAEVFKLHESEIHRMLFTDASKFFNLDDQLKASSTSIRFLIVRARSNDIAAIDDVAIEKWMHAVETILSGSNHNSIAVYKPIDFFGALRFASILSSKANIETSIRNQLLTRCVFEQEVSLVVTFHGYPEKKSRDRIEQARFSIIDSNGDFIAGYIEHISKWLSIREIMKVIEFLNKDLNCNSQMYISQVTDIKQDDIEPKFYSQSGWKSLSDIKSLPRPNFIH